MILLSSMVKALTPAQVQIEVNNLPFVEFAKQHLKIKDKKGNIIPFELNQAQQKVDEIFENTRKEGKLLRFIVLKARQEGISTYTEGKIFKRNAREENRSALIVAHEADASTNLFNMFKTYYDYLHPFLQPSIKHSNEKKLSFGVLKSEIRVATAEAREKLGRSSTIQDLHCSEVAFWSDAKSAMLALLQVVPDEENTLVVVESTANGVGGWFYDTWQDAVNGNNDFIPIFLAWFDLPTYSRDFANNEEKARLEESLNEYEIALINKYSLSLEQINWYRYTLKNKCNNDPDEMKQEYPSTPEEAFITSGRPVFDRIITYNNYLESKEPIAIGNLVYVYDTAHENIVNVEFVHDKRGFFKVYKNFTIDDDEYNVFAAGCDVAEGLEQGDYNSIRILDRRNNTVIAEWHGHLDPDLLADEQHKIYLWLNKQVYIGTEANNHGLTTIVGAYKHNVKQYYRQDYTKGYEAQKMELGFKTTQVTKPFAINMLSEAIREKTFIDYSKLFWGEALTFVKNEKGQMQAQGKDKDPSVKNYDDTVMATSIMLVVHSWMPNYIRKKNKELPPHFQAILDQKKERERRNKQGSSGLTIMSG